MTFVELATASLQSSYSDASEGRTVSSTRGTISPRSYNIPGGSSSSTQSTANNTAFGSFKSLASTSGEFQEGIQKTFSNLVNNFSHKESFTNVTPTEDDRSAQSWGISSKWSQDSFGKRWSEFVFPEGLRSRVSSLSSNSGSYESDPSQQSGFQLRKNQGMHVHVEESNLAGISRQDSGEFSPDGSEASWPETSSRDVSLLDTIGESNEEEGSESDGDSQSSDDGSDSLEYEYDDDSTEFDSEVGLDDLGTVIMKLGSCHFEPEGAFGGDEMLPPSVAKFIGKSKSYGSGHSDDDTGLLTPISENNSRDLEFDHQKQMMAQQYMDQRFQDGNNDAPPKSMFSSLFSKAFTSCGAI